jgi:Mg2+ and Co2+ transporter CorA
MATTAFSVVLKEIEDRREQIAQALISGGARDFSEYKSMTGEIRGLSQAHVYIIDLVDRLKRLEDE